jgi:hypothetical protein
MKILKDSLNFSQALELIRKGKLVQRLGWNGKDMFVFLRPDDEIHIDTVIDKVKSLPDNVKEYFKQDTLNDNGERMYPADECVKIKFTSYLCLKDANGNIVNGWSPSQTDMLKNDWLEVSFDND